MDNGTSSEASVSRIAIDGKNFCFLKCIPESVYEHVDPTPELICGTLEHEEADVAQGVIRHRHHILMHPSPQELALILPKCGFTESPAGTFTIQDTVAQCDLEIDRVEQAYGYDVSFIDVAILRSQKGKKPWSLELQVVSQSEAEVAWTATDIATRSAPFAFHEGALLNLHSANRRFNQAALILDHKMASRFENDEEVDTIQPTDHDFYFATSTPFTTTEKDLYDEATGSTREAGTALSWTNSRGGLSFNAAIANAKWMAQPPHIKSKFDHIRLDQFYRLYKSGSTASVIITLDSTE